MADIDTTALDSDSDHIKAARPALLAVVQRVNDLADTSDVAKGDALVAEKRTATGAVATTEHASNELRKFDVARDFGVDGASSDAAVLSAVQLAIAAAGALTKGGVVEVPGFVGYGLKTTDSTTWPYVAGLTKPYMVLDYGYGSTYAGYPTIYDGAQWRLWLSTPQTTATVTFTAGILSSATSATLASAWALDTGPWTVTFSNSDVRAVTFTNGATTATWTGGLTSGATASAVYIRPGQHDGNSAWVRGEWAPVICVSNDANLQAVGHSSRRATDNRRAGFALMKDGKAAWQWGMGNRAGAALTEEQLMNCFIQMFSMTGDTMGAFVPWLCERLTSYVSYGGGRSLPRAHHDFEPSSGSPSGYLALFDEGGASTRVALRSGSSGNDVLLKNTAGVFAVGTGAGDAIQVDVTNRRTWIPGSLRLRRSTPTYGTTVSFDSASGNMITITATNGTAFAIAQPASGSDGVQIVITVRNTSGGALGAVTWSAAYKMSAWVSPANGYSRTITFLCDGTDWIEQGRTPADVPN